MSVWPKHLLPLLALELACGAPTAPDASGSWGGPQASLTLSRAGGTISYPCGVGIIDSAWNLTRIGRFTATGRHYFGGGPLPPQGHPPHPASYEGQLKGQVFTLQVTLTDEHQVLGPFRLIRGGPPVAEQCL
jgi:hypothetical protein